MCSDSSDPFVTHCSVGLGVFGNSIDLCIAWQHNAQYGVYKCMRYASSPRVSGVLRKRAALTFSLSASNDPNLVAADGPGCLD